MKLSWLVGVLALLFVTKLADSINLAASHRLYQKLFAKYNKNLRPVHKSKTVTTVTLNPVLHTIQDVNELQELLVVNQWLHMEWNDMFLRWDPNEFQGETSIEVPAKLIWLPDLYIQGVIDKQETPAEDDTFCDINYDGIVHCQFNQIVKVHCDFDIVLFPFDLQNCTLKYGSWVYNAEQVDLTTESSNGTTTFYQDNTEWWLLSYTNERYYTNYTRGSAFVDVVFNIAILRKPMYYMLTLVLPSCVITTLSLIGLFSPFNSTGERQEKVTMGLTTLLTMAVLLLVISEQMPKTSKGLPLIGIYILFEIIIASLATCVTVVIMRLHIGATEMEGIPKWLQFVTKVKTTGEKKHKKNKPTESNSKTKLVTNGITREQSMESTDTEEQVELAQIILQQMLSNLIEIRNYADMQRKDIQLTAAWAKACDRLDLIMMILFVTVNVSVTVFVVTMGCWVH